MSPKARRCSSCGHANRPYEVDSCRKCGAEFLWRRSFGRKSYNLVTVYERVAGGPVQIMWWERGRSVRETMTNLDGVPVYDHDHAVEVARAISAGIARELKKRQSTLRGIVGAPELHTVGELFEQLHRDLRETWSPKHRTGQRRFRRFWETALGKTTDITQVDPAMVSRIIQREAKAKGWSLKTQNHYLDAAVEAWNYAEVQLKWIPAEKNLAAVKRHRVPVDNDDITYAEAEAKAIVDVAEQVDLRCAVAVDLSFLGSRRITAIQHLTTDAYRTEQRIVRADRGERPQALEFGVVTFPAATDKARKKGEVYLFGRAKERLERLLATPAVRVSGLVFPKDDLSSSTPPAEPVTQKFLRRWLRAAEKLAGVEYVKGRSFHGFNRTFASTHDDALAASGQAGKRRDTMEAIYEGARPEDKAALSVRMDRKLLGA